VISGGVGGPLQRGVRMVCVAS